MAKSEMIRARTEPKLKREVEKIFHALGLTFTEAINLFFRQVKLQHGIPFDVKIPNQTTLKAIKNIENGKNIIRSKNKKEMFDKIGIP